MFRQLPAVPTVLSQTKIRMQGWNGPKAPRERAEGPKSSTVLPPQCLPGHSCTDSPPWPQTTRPKRASRSPSTPRWVPCGGRGQHSASLTCFPFCKVGWCLPSRGTSSLGPRLPCLLPRSRGLIQKALPHPCLACFWLWRLYFLCLSLHPIAWGGPPKPGKVWGRGGL